MLEICNLMAGYGQQPVLNNVTINVEAGKITAVIGPNGCGKSTLLKTICGILKPSGGRILLEGTSLCSLKNTERARKIAYLSQNRKIPQIEVEQLVLYGRYPYLSLPHNYKAEDRRIAQQAMQRMKIESLAKEKLNHLSGGERQKAYIAMTIAQNTSVLLLDEPNTWLDAGYQLQMMELARELADDGKYVIMVIHDIVSAIRHADSIVLMNDGSTVQQGTPEEVYSSGNIDQIFGIHLTRYETEAGYLYGVYPPG